ncbi:uncharacterized protein LOC108665491, partial [Hyalella azteca]|uniref:Uncharacterized protein LOC108665491 n=1 Tax=Hyalella azteca TaxID=294128 RepID=A0A979FJ49_HYAAZ
MSHKISKCQVLLHQLPAAAMGRGWCAMPSLAQVCADAGSVKCEVLDAGTASSSPKVPMENIKEELMDAMEIISVKEEPFNYDEKACEPPSSGCGDPPVPPPPLCVPCKRKAPHGAPQTPQQPSNNVGVTRQKRSSGASSTAGGATAAAGGSGHVSAAAAGGGGHVSAAAAGGSGHVNRQIPDKHARKRTYHCADCDY